MKRRDGSRPVEKSVTRKMESHNLLYVEQGLLARTTYSRGFVFIYY